LLRDNGWTWDADKLCNGRDQHLQARGGRDDHDNDMIDVLIYTLAIRINQTLSGM